MNNSPFSFLESVAARLQPPTWLVNEGQQRLVLFLNHVLMQEPQARERLLRQKGRIVNVRWGMFTIDLIVTPAGLADLAPAGATADLLLSVAADSPLTVVQSVMAGKPPPVKIEGDVQFAAELGWLAENLRWDVEEDLSRVIGDAPAHAVADAGRRVVAGLRQFLANNPLASKAAGATASGTPPAAPVAPYTAPQAAPVAAASTPTPASPGTAA